MQSQRLIQHTGSAELTIEGKNLKDTLRLLHDGVEYTPLTSTENSVTFILGDNGTNRIYVNGEYSFGIQISGIVVPEGLPARITLSQSSSITPDTDLSNNKMVSGYCNNYGYKATDSLPYFNIKLDELKKAYEEENFEFVNCSIVGKYVPTTNKQRIFKVSPTAVNEVSYIMLEGFIIAVFNYE